MPPADFADGNSKRFGNTLSLGRTWRPSSQRDRLDPLKWHVRPLSDFFY
jgi:hypothetical protein